MRPHHSPHCLLYWLCAACLALAVSPAWAGFEHGGDSINPISPPPAGLPPLPNYALMQKACADLAAVNPQAAAGIKDMLENTQINEGHGANTAAGGAWTVADGQPGVEGDAININPEFLTGGTVPDEDGDPIPRHDPNKPETCSGSTWNRLLGALAHEWVHANSGGIRPTSADTSAWTDYWWEKPAYEKEMAVLVALGEPTGYLPPPAGGGPTAKTRHEFLRQELEKKKQRANLDLDAPRDVGSYSISAGAGEAERTYTCSLLGADGTPLSVTWGVDGGILYCMDPLNELSHAVALPLEEELCFLGLENLPQGTGSSLLLVGGTAGADGVLLGLEINGAELVAMRLAITLPAGRPASLAYRPADGSLWVLDTAGDAILKVEDADGDFIPDSLVGEPYATAVAFPVLETARALAVYPAQEGVGVAATGFVPFDVVPIDEPLTFILDADGDGAADATIESSYLAFTKFAPRLLGHPTAGAGACSIYGIGGAEVSVWSCDADGNPTELLGAVTLAADGCGEVALIRPLSEGERVRLLDPVNDTFGEAAPYLVPPAGTNHPPVPVRPDWQVVEQEGPGGAAVTLDGSASFDPDGDALTFTWQELVDSYDGGPVLGTGPVLTVDLAPGVHVIRLAVSDGVTESRDYTAVAVRPNSLPVVAPIGGPAAPVPVGTTVSMTGTFTDAESGDSHTAEWTWGDGAVSPAVVVEAAGAGTASGSHTYEAAGVYEVALKVTDSVGGSATAAYQYVVVYDTAAGYVTGHGAIHSPPGAYVADPTLADKARFGFVSKYQKGAQVPSGTTRFQFKVADLEFYSESYQWLVVAGARAQYKGTGSINGAGSYGFLLTAVDGALLGKDAVDRFRIKIWDPASGEAVYDNQLGAADGAEPATEVVTGQILVHSK